MAKLDKYINDVVFVQILVQKTQSIQRVNEFMELRNEIRKQTIFTKAIRKNKRGLKAIEALLRQYPESFKQTQTPKQHF
jgi:hypothetical protein